VVKVVDFGIARIAAEALTLRGEPLGTPSWMAPEQARGETCTTGTDVWAVGLVVFYMLTARRFWRSEGDAHVLREIAYDPVPIASIRGLELGVSELVPRGFDEWFAQCVARSPNDRFVNAAGAYAALSQVLRG